MNFIGNIDILNNRKTAFLCSRKIPADIVLKTYDWAIEKRDTGVCVMSGFHSPIEKDVLKFLIDGVQPLIIVLARSMLKSFDETIVKGISKGRILIVSPFDETIKRASEQTAFIRNRYMVDTAEELYIPYMSPGGNLQRLMKELKKINRS